jgi:hypothetical protein
LDWRSDGEREAEWTYRLSPLEIAEIETALRGAQARGLDIAEIRREDFPLPTLGPVLDWLRAEVLDGRGFVLLRGMPVEDRPIAESATAYWGIGTYFGSARSQNAQGHLLGHDPPQGAGGRVRCRFAAGAEWIRTFSTAMPRHHRQRGCLRSTMGGGSWFAVLRPTSGRG